MSEIILAKCGLLCNECPAYKATIEDSDTLRKSTAEEWSKLFGSNIDWKSINCLGCQQDEKLFGHCQVCGIRSCAKDKNHITCGSCAEIGCEKVKEIWQHDPTAEKRLRDLV